MQIKVSSYSNIFSGGRISFSIISFFLQITLLYSDNNFETSQLNESLLKTKTNQEEEHTVHLDPPCCCLLHMAIKK